MICMKDGETYNGRFSLLFHHPRTLSSFVQKVFLWHPRLIAVVINTFISTVINKSLVILASSSPGHHQLLLRFQFQCLQSSPKGVDQKSLSLWIRFLISLASSYLLSSTSTSSLSLPGLPFTGYLG